MIDTSYYAGPAPETLSPFEAKAVAAIQATGDLYALRAGRLPGGGLAVAAWSIKHCGHCLFTCVEQVANATALDALYEESCRYRDELVQADIQQMIDDGLPADQAQRVANDYPYRMGLLCQAMGPLPTVYALCQRIAGAWTLPLMGVVVARA